MTSSHPPEQLETYSFRETYPRIDRPHSNALLCPCCGFNYLHSGKVVVYDRGEDAEIGCATTVDDGMVTQTPDLAGNPSARRHAVTVEFTCEGCGGWDDRPIRLALYQHKGCTYLKWV